MNSWAILKNIKTLGRISIGGYCIMDIEVLKECCQQRKILWSTHAAARIQQRGIFRADVINCIKNF